MKWGINMEALIILDVQEGMLKHGDYSQMLDTIQYLVDDFSREDKPIISFRHIDDNEESSIYKGSTGAELVSVAKDHSDYIIEKRTPDIFSGTELQQILEEHNIDEVAICGFNAEFCCLFSAIILTHNGIKVNYIEDATGSVNDGDVYEMADLDIVDFVGCVLDWSGVVDVFYYEEYRKK